MATVHKATIDLFDRIYPLLEYFNVEGMNREDWFLLLSTRRSTRHEHFGYVLMEGEDIVGFLGAFFCERNINGVEHAICNLFCWYVLEEHRRESLLLLVAILDLKDTTVTSLTSSRDALMIYERFQFKPLESKVRIFPLMPVVSSKSGVEFVTDPNSIRSKLNPQDRKLFDDHAFPSCRHLVLVSRTEDQEYCYLVYNSVRKKGLLFTQVCFISNRMLFDKTFSRIQWYFFKKNRTFFTVIDKRLIAGSNPGAGMDYTLRYPRLYRSTDLQPEQIDNLYTELLFLKRI